MSVQSIGVLYGEMGTGFRPNVIQPFLENIDRQITVTTEPGDGTDGSYLGVHCRGAK